MILLDEPSPERLRILDSSRGLRVAAVVLLGFYVAGVGMVVLLSFLKLSTKVECDHASGICEFRFNKNQADQFAIDTIQSVAVEPAYPSATPEAKRTDARIALHRTAQPAYKTYCNTSGDIAKADAVRAEAEQLQGFLADKSAPAVTFACEARALDLGGVNTLAIIPASLGGFAILFLMFMRFAAEIRTVMDLKERTITVEKRSLFAWTGTTRRLDDIVEVVNVMRGGDNTRGRHFEVIARFADGSAEPLWRPGVTTPATIARHIAIVNEFLARRDAEYR